MNEEELRRCYPRADDDAIAFIVRAYHNQHIVKALQDLRESEQGETMTDDGKLGPALIDGGGADPRFPDWSPQASGPSLGDILTVAHATASSTDTDGATDGATDETDADAMHAQLNKARPPFVPDEEGDAPPPWLFNGDWVRAVYAYQKSRGYLLGQDKRLVRGWKVTVRAPWGLVGCYQTTERYMVDDTTETCLSEDNDEWVEVEDVAMTQAEWDALPEFDGF